MINVSLNNQQLHIGDNTSLVALLEKHSSTSAFAVAINGEFVPRSSYAEVCLADGDEVDLVSPVGGG